MRDVQERDLDGIIQVHVSCIQQLCSLYYSEDVVQKWVNAQHEYSSWINDATHFLVVVDRDDNVVAFAYTGKPSTELSSSEMDFELYKLYVSPAMGRRGIGKRLIKEIEKRISNDGGNGIVLRSSMNALPFYEACGYRRVLTGMEHIACVGEARIEYKRLEKLISSNKNN